ncbi:hypothetical protein VU07_02530, partial [Desulfobulbus sp. F4]|nr:hypothetical protein [Desulfobulbus sp. F4]
GMARILQGGHFPSDILWAGGLLYLIGGTLALLMRIDRSKHIFEKTDEVAVSTAYNPIAGCCHQPLSSAEEMRT